MVVEWHFCLHLLFMIFCVFSLSIIGVRQILAKITVNKKRISASVSVTDHWVECCHLTPPCVTTFFGRQEIITWTTAFRHSDLKYSLFLNEVWHNESSQGSLCACSHYVQGAALLFPARYFMVTALRLRHHYGDKHFYSRRKAAQASPVSTTAFYTTAICASTTLEGY